MQTPYDVSRACVAVLCAALLTSCGKDAPPPPKPRAAPPGVLITATQVQPRRFEVLEEVVGSLENVMDPKLGAEVAGKVIRVLGFAGKKVKKGELLAEIDAKDFEIQARTDSAEIARLTTLLEQADRLVERQAKLVEKGFVSQNVVDDATAQRNAQRDQLAAARAQRAGAAQHRQGEGRRAAGRRDRAPGRRRGRLRQGRRPAVHAGRHARAARAAAAGVARRTARPSRMRSEVISGSSTYPRES